MMKPWKWIPIFGMACLVALAAKAQDDGPSYQGHTLREWVVLYEKAACAKSKDETNACEAIRHIGTNALPYLIKWIQVPSKPWLTNEAERFPDYAGFAFKAFGATASNTIPELKTVLHQTERVFHGITHGCECCRVGVLRVSEQWTGDE